jgi:hypothetical protein
MVAQAQLNIAFPHAKALVVDGVFGPLTRARVLEFQRARRLSANAVVDSLTWGALGQVRSTITPARDSAICDNANPAHQSQASLLGNAFHGGALRALAPPLASARPAVDSPAVAAPASLTLGSLTLVPLVGSLHEATARGVYLTSLHYDRIFLSNGTGLEGRAFTLTVPVPPLVVPSLPSGGFVQVLNIGTAPDRDTLIHELGHAWQSQHHAMAAAYIANCLACQGAAVAANEVMGLLDPSVQAHPRFPVNFPLSAYAYRPGAVFATYAGEQIAQQLENGEPGIVAHAASKAAGTVDKANEASLEASHIRLEDRRAPGVKM